MFLYNYHSNCIRILYFKLYYIYKLVFSDLFKNTILSCLFKLYVKLYPSIQTLCNNLPYFFYRLVIRITLKYIHLSFDLMIQINTWIPKILSKNFETFLYSVERATTIETSLLTLLRYSTVTTPLIVSKSGELRVKKTR